jgi:hypothetical protein
MIDHISKDNHNHGYVALVTVLIVAAIGISIVISGILTGIGSVRSSFVGDESLGVKSLANACAEEALEKINESSFVGTGSLTMSTGTCTYSTASASGTWTITSSSTIGGVVRKVKVTASSTSPSIQISSWQEVTDF